MEGKKPSLAALAATVLLALAFVAVVASLRWQIPANPQAAPTLVSTFPSPSLPPPTHTAAPPAETPTPPEVLMADPYDPTTVLPFPTPAFPPVAGTLPKQTQRMRFLLYPHPLEQPMLRPVVLDARGQRWGISEEMIDLGLDARYPGPPPVTLYSFPQQRRLIAKIGRGPYTDLAVIDLETKAAKRIYETDELRFYALHPNGRQALAEEVSINETGIVSR
ncbi:MAG: hypothetical protein RML99_11515, partial [Anaerolineae bacterium]|nr:hypothetical protein [Anaerolineae bacterium]